MSTPVIHAEHLGKRYRIEPRQRERTVRGAVASLAARAAAHLRGRGAGERADEIWALDDLSFEVSAGDTIGIIGRNGAGKSTLLKVLSRITEPTTGFVDVTGRVGSLLEVGTGFHEDLSGRENTYLNGAILGMTRAEIDRKFDEIVAFAEIDRFIDTPVKHYSSGMYMRLAFAVAAHLETEIIVVEEVLAVGDVVSAYREVERTLIDVGRFNPRGRRGSGWAYIVDVRLLDERGACVSARPSDCDLLLELDLEVDKQRGASLRGQLVHLVISANDGHPLVSLLSVDDGGVELPAASRCTLRMRLGGPTFVPGRYRINAFLGVPGLEHVDEIPDAFEFDILPPTYPWRPFEMSPASGPVCRRAEWIASVPSQPPVSL